MSHRTIVVVDVANFTSPERTSLHERTVREGLYRVLHDAFSEVGFDLDACTVEDRGDGELILMPAGVDNSLLADLLPGRLAEGLRRHNAVSDEAKIQLRVAFHSGEVLQDNRGTVGAAVNLAFCLVDAPEAKSMLKLSPSVLALIASDDFYHDVIVHNPAAYPDAYQKIRVRVNKSSEVAWLSSNALAQGAYATKLAPPQPFLRAVGGRESAARLLGIPTRQLAELTGDSLPAQRLRDIIRVVNSAGEIWDEQIVATWLRSPNGFLNGSRPIDVLALEGPTEVLDALDAAAGGAFA